ncbi:MAG: hypothetical protein AAFP84_08780 [Actinomycetota bacterium]
MTTHTDSRTRNHDALARTRTRWAALGAAVAVTLGAGGIHLTHAAPSDDDPISFHRIDPCRLHDSRPEFQIGDHDTPIGPNETRVFDAWGTNGDCTIPSDALAIAVNAIGIEATEPTFLTLHADTATLEPPNASNLNVVPGQPPTPNFAIVPLDSTGRFAMYNAFGDVDTVIDVVGYTSITPLDDRFAHVAAAGQGAAGFVGDDPLTVTSTELDIPEGVDGYLLVNSSVNVVDQSAGDRIRCSISEFDDVHATAQLQEWFSPGSPAGGGQLSGTRLFTPEFVPDAVYLVCDHEGASAPGTFNNAMITAAFLPSAPGG